MAERAQGNGGEQPIYVLYDREDGRIRGTYKHYDADQGHCVPCDPDDVLKAAAGASDELTEGRFLVLETTTVDGEELRDLKVDTRTRKLVSRRPRKSKA